MKKYTFLLLAFILILSNAWANNGEFIKISVPDNSNYELRLMEDYTSSSEYAIFEIIQGLEGIYEVNGVKQTLNFSSKIYVKDTEERAIFGLADFRWEFIEIEIPSGEKIKVNASGHIYNKEGNSFSTKRKFLNINPIIKKDVKADAMFCTNADYNTYPKIGDGDIISIIFEAEQCWGACPEYKLEFFSDGNLKYIGEKFVSDIGQKESKIDESVFNSLAKSFKNKGFFTMKDEYRGKESEATYDNFGCPMGVSLNWVDHCHERIMTVKTTIGTKEVKNCYEGPKELEELEELLINTAKQVIPGLLKEKE